MQIGGRASRPVRCRQRQESPNITQTGHCIAKSGPFSGCPKSKQKEIPRNSYHVFLEFSWRTRAWHTQLELILGGWQSKGAGKAVTGALPALSHRLCSRRTLCSQPYCLHSHSSKVQLKVYCLHETSPELWWSSVPAFRIELCKLKRSSFLYVFLKDVKLLEDSYCVRVMFK